MHFPRILSRREIILRRRDSQQWPVSSGQWAAAAGDGAGQDGLHPAPGGRAETLAAPNG